MTDYCRIHGWADINTPCDCNQYTEGDGIIFELKTAQYCPKYHPEAPWRDVMGFMLTESGNPPIAWRYLAYNGDLLGDNK